MHIEPSLKWLLGLTLVGYVLLMYAIGWWASRRIDSTEDYLVAGRKLPLSLAWLTIVATWFGAGTLLSVADEVRATGLSAIALDPLGAGLCLWFVALFVAGPMWRLKLLTVADFFRLRYGRTVEILSVLILTPSYFGWIAAQFTAVAGMLELFFGLPIWLGILLVAVIGTGYTLMGGMWSVTLTDAVQISLVLLGLIVLSVVVLTELGEGDSWRGVSRLATELPAEKLELMPRSSWVAWWGWLGVLATGVLGNVPGQDLMQRLFASRSDRVAQASCWIAGGVYLVFGMVPVVLALASDLLIPANVEEAVLPALAQAFLSPWVAVVFVVALMSAVLSTIDSAILAPASVLSQNLFRSWSRVDPVRLDRWMVVIVAIASVGFAYRGEQAYALLEEAYALTMVGLLVPLLLGLWTKSNHAIAAAVSMLTGVTTWSVHFLVGWETFLEGLPCGPWIPVPISIAATLLAWASFWVCDPPWRRGKRASAAAS